MSAGWQVCRARHCPVCWKHDPDFARSTIRRPPDRLKRFNPDTPDPLSV